MPRATFRGHTFDLLLEGLQDAHGGHTTVREIPGGSSAYVDLGGPLLQRRTVTLKVDTESTYWTLASYVGTSMAAGTLVSAEGSLEVVLLTVSRYWRKGSGPQLLRTEWVVTG